ncbi:MAG: hypothetical protein AAGH19_02290, partial [Pseudomonadota bacterium]
MQHHEPKTIVTATPRAQASGSTFPGTQRAGCSGLFPTFVGLALLLATTLTVAADTLTIDHRFQLASVGNPTISPDGNWVAYTISRENLEDDSSNTRIWMVPLAGGTPVPLSAAHTSSWSPRWSPDGRYLGFLSAREGGETQVWSLNLSGGEAVALTDTPQSVSSFSWSPEARHLALVLQDLKPAHQAALE